MLENKIFQIIWIFQKSADETTTTKNMKLLIQQIFVIEKVNFTIKSKFHDNFFNRDVKIQFKRRQHKYIFI